MKKKQRKKKRLREKDRATRHARIVTGARWSALLTSVDARMRPAGNAVAAAGAPWLEMGEILRDSIYSIYYTRYTCKFVHSFCSLRMN